MGQKIISFVNAWSGEKFVWGQTDCAMLTLRFLDYMYDWHLFEYYEDSYKNEADAEYFSVYSTDMRQILISAGFTDMPVGFEKQGDILLCAKNPGVYNSHIDLGDSVFSSHPDHGLRIYPKRGLKNYEVLRCPAPH